jgi:uncharacterized protein (UPF0332 family)
MRLRLEKAQETLNAAILLAESEAFKDAANRSYYCILNTMRAVLAQDRFDSKKHSGIISEFGRRYIKAGIFPKEFSKMIYSAFDVRNNCDYEDFYIISKEEVLAQINNAKTIIDAVTAYLNTVIQDFFN